MADLTAAALFYPTVLPAEAPRLPDPPAAYREFQAEFADRRGYAYVKEMFRRHRKRPAAKAAA